MATAQSVSYYQGSMPSVSTPGVGLRSDGFQSTGNDVWSGIVRFFGGEDIKQGYQNALTENNRAYEQAMLKGARDYETWFDSTAVQRRIQDIKAAGLNPWLALQNGGIGANGTSSSASQPGSGSSAKSSGSNRNQLSSLAMLLVSTARLLAAL